jgi:hypothetical protein
MTTLSNQQLLTVAVVLLLVLVDDAVAGKCL